MCLLKLLTIAVAIKIDENEVFDRSNDKEGQKKHVLHIIALVILSVHELYVWLRIYNYRLPPGVINVLPGGSDVGQLLVTHTQVSKLVFSGLTGVGRIIRKQTAGLGMHLTLCK
jgi:hypothetical protein